MNPMDVISRALCTPIAIAIAAEYVAAAFAAAVRLPTATTTKHWKICKPWFNCVACRACFATICGY
jgi:hypothetical protein